MKIQIPTPCHENWEAMKPGENGRYCGACCKTVVDFTGMAPDAIANYLILHRLENICGRLTEKQLTMEYDTNIQVAVTHIAQSGWPPVKKIAAAFILFLALSQVGNAQVAKETLQQIVVTGGIKRKAKIVPEEDPFAVAVPAPIPFPNKVQCLEGWVGGVVITPQKKAKRKLNQRKKRQQKKENAATPLTGEVVVVAGMVQAN